ncbi:DUF1289 domain-containing protein [Ideonella sp.]|uniref:DUF1289 domain-containing protein n=1 Tax=Ideonella sp. TaxID=1929293 RepID=UPI0035B14876
MNAELPPAPPLASPDPVGGPAAAPAGPGVPSPCTSVCRMNDRTGWCEGCYRTIDEIIAWSKMADDGKRQVWRLLPARRQAQAKKGA